MNHPINNKKTGIDVSYSQGQINCRKLKITLILLLFAVDTAIISNPRMMLTGNITQMRVPG